MTVPLSAYNWGNAGSRRTSCFRRLGVQPPTPSPSVPVKLILKGTPKQGHTVCFSALSPVPDEASSIPWDKASGKKKVPDTLGSSWVGGPATPAPTSEPTSFSALTSQEYVSIHGTICTRGRDIVLQMEDIQEGTSKEEISL